MCRIPGGQFQPQGVGRCSGWGEENAWDGASHHGRHLAAIRTGLEFLRGLVGGRLDSITQK